MNISIVTDEISADPETAIELAVEWGVHAFELRGYGAKRVPDLSSYEKEKLLEVTDRYQARIIGISPGLFKFPYQPSVRESFPVQTIDAEIYTKWKSARDKIQYQLYELLPTSIEYAKEIGADLIICFGFHRGTQPAGEAPDEVLEVLRQAAQLSGEAGIRLAIEVEANFWADTGERTAQMMRAVHHSNLIVNWDPGNSILAGENPYPEGYQYVRDLVAHVHFKDIVISRQGTHEYVIDGQIDWSGQIQALASQGYDGYISVETHMQPKIRSTKAMLMRLQQLIDNAGNGNNDRNAGGG